MAKETILVVDDEKNIVELAKLYLEKEGYRVEDAYDGTEALAKIKSLQPALVVLDLMLPEIDGWEVCRRVRRESDVPIIMLTARDDDVDKIVGLELGADDYLVKPFNPRELSARIRAVLRRQAELKAMEVHVAHMQTALETAGPGEGLRFDHPRRRVWFRGQPLEFRPREYDLLHFLSRHRGQVFTRESLLSHVWGYESYIGTRTVDVHVRRLRSKLATIALDAQVILTEWGIGYRMAEDV